ncbi:MAG: translation initiation factor IF-3 [Polyangiaceae bacterium]|nr:translation initiation factor IF-3 [Polyangiaceae bacterium]MCW5789610.1 translation initiation factor IF-3 [Polyangiaceae bacterium]
MAMRRRFHRAEPRGPQIRINHRIRVPEVRVVAADGSMLGVMTTQEALRRAREEGLDLVEVNPKSMPPVCKILDFGKYKYEEKKRASDAKRRQTVVEVKELKLRPKTDDHDLNVKLRAARKFLESGNKVKFTVRFRGREITHPERAKMQLDWLLQGLEDLTTVEQMPAMEGRTMVLIVAPKPAVMQRVQAERAARERNAELRRERGEAPEEEIEEEEEDLDDEDDDDDDDDDDESEDDESED